MSANPDRIRRDIEQTRDELSSDVDALTDRVNPRRMANERMGQARGALGRARERIMGTASHARQAGGGRASEASHRTAETASSMRDRAKSMPHMSMERTEGSPLAAGLIAFGVGLLAAALVPPSRSEQQLAGQAKRTAMEHSDEFKQQASGAAQQMRDNLREPAQHAAEAVKSKAAGGASAVRDESRGAAQNLQGQARHAGEDIRRQ